MKKTSRDVLDAVARQHIPDDANLFPRIAAKLERKTMMQTLRTRPALALLIVLLALSLLSGVVYAVGRSLGYIPGVGIVEQGVHMRVLAEPISVTRDGITLTVTDAILASDKTIILYTFENIPWDALSHQEGVPECYEMPFLHLPNGVLLFSREGGGGMGQMRLVYPPIPTKVNEATFMLPCIMDTLPGFAPENWELNLQFKPAPPDMTIVPVIEITPVPDADSVSTAPSSPFTLTQVMQIGEETILSGNISPSGPDGLVEMRSLILTDANGNAVFSSPPKVDGLLREGWSVQFQSNIAYPLTLTFESVFVAPVSESMVEIEFDAGENPQSGQEWTLNQPIEIGGRTIMLDTVQTEGKNGYKFNFSGDPDIIILSLDIPGYAPEGGSGGGWDGQFSVSLSYPELPVGKLKLVLSNLVIESPLETWTIEWSPENLPEEDPLYGISLNVEQLIPLDDGYYLIGHIEWTDERIQSVHEAENMRAYDATGQEIAFEKAKFSETIGLVENLDESQWVYHLYGKNFNGPLTLELGKVYIMFEPALEFTLELTSSSFEFNDDHINIPYKLGEYPLDFPELPASAFKATYIKEANLHGFEIGIEADPRLHSLIFQFPSELDAEGNYIYATGDSYRDGDLLLAWVLTDSQMSFPLRLIARDATVSGSWTTKWTPPTAESAGQPDFIPQVCLTFDKWMQLIEQDDPFVSEIGGKIITTVNEGDSFPAIYVSSLDGTNLQKVAIGAWPSFSNDGTQLAYSDADGLHIVDLSTGQDSALGIDGYRIIWSPDDTRLMFTSTPNLYIINVDGSGLQKINSASTQVISPVGWLPDNQTIFYSIMNGGGFNLKSHNPQSGEIKDLFKIHNKAGYGAISPDGQWIVFADQISGGMWGIFISRLDGSDRKMVAEPKVSTAFASVWGPDSQWLIVNTQTREQEAIPVLVNPFTCQATRLNFDGMVEGWSQ